MKRTILGLLATIATMPLITYGRDVIHYVVPAGTDGNTPDAPYTSWETAANDLADVLESSDVRDTILVAPGTYSIDSTIDIADSKKSLRIESFNAETGEQDPEHTILDGGGTTAIMALRQQYAYVSGFTFANGYYASDTYRETPSAVSAAVTFYGNQPTVSNCIFKCNKSVNVVGTCLYSNGKAQAVVADCKFLCNTQEVTVAGDYPVKGSAVYITLASDNADNYASLSGCTFSGNVGKGPKAQGSMVALPNGRTVIDNCNFYTNSFTQTDSARDTSGAYLYFGINTTMRNCRVSCEGFGNSGGRYLYGSVLNAGNNFLCSNCTFSAISETAGSNMYGTICVNGDSISFVDCRFTDNTLNSSALFFINDKGDELFRNCLFAGNKRGSSVRMIQANGATTTKTTRFSVENCTFADNADNYALITLAAGNTAYSCNLVNSVFSTGTILSAAANNASLSARNCCFAASPANVTDGGGNIIKTVAEMKFVDAANGDWHLQDRSPLREGGTVLPWMTSDATDLDGNPRILSKYGKPLSRDPSGLPDIGCYECTIALIPGLAIVIR